MNSKKTSLHHGAGLCQNLGRMDARKAAASHLSGFAISSLRQRYRKTIVPSFLWVTIGNMKNAGERRVLTMTLSRSVIRYFYHFILVFYISFLI
ncbi:hypothetical protein [Agrobacterium deltaense]|uniref:hypothetical protein n=1 Tax=Agrobacterium deltaense TaxID=1183412 RepID=UPI00196989B6|nr:hypothetical protein [Agrobacterium deltaense]